MQIAEEAMPLLQLPNQPAVALLLLLLLRKLSFPTPAPTAAVQYPAIP
jgi:hypothetical protein